MCHSQARARGSSRSRLVRYCVRYACAYSRKVASPRENSKPSLPRGIKPKGFCEHRSTGHRGDRLTPGREKMREKKLRCHMFYIPQFARSSRMPATTCRLTILSQSRDQFYARRRNRVDAAVDAVVDAEELGGQATELCCENQPPKKRRKTAAPVPLLGNFKVGVVCRFVVRKLLEKAYGADAVETTTRLLL